MKCPYCDDSIHPMAKFCPKCGLPLKEDATLQGTYVVDDSGPSPWVIVAGAAGIATIALLIGWMSGQNHNNDAPKVDAKLPAPPPISSFNPGFQTAYRPQSTQFTGPMVDYNPHVKWAYVPAPPTSVAPTYYAYQPQPMAPENMGTLKVLMRPVSLPVGEITPPRPESPAIPPMPAYIPYASADAATGAAAAAGGYDGFGDTHAPPASWQENDKATYLWDPVHERWALNVDRSHRKASGRVVAPRNDAPVIGPVPVPAPDATAPDASKPASGL